MKKQNKKAFTDVSVCFISKVCQQSQNCLRVCFKAFNSLLSFHFDRSPLHLRGNQGQIVYQPLNTRTSLQNIASHPPIVFIKSCICEFPEVSNDPQKFKGQSRAHAFTLS